MKGYKLLEALTLRAQNETVQAAGGINTGGLRMKRYKLLVALTLGAQNERVQAAGGINTGGSE